MDQGGEEEKRDRGEGEKWIEERRRGEREIEGSLTDAGNVS